MVHLYQLLVKKAVVYHTLTTFSTDDNDPTSNNSISAFLQKTVMERSNAPLTCCIRKSNHNNHLAKIYDGSITSQQYTHHPIIQQTLA